MPLAPSFCWRRMLEAGAVATIRQIATRKPTPLAPYIVESILDGRQLAELGVHLLREGFPVEWGEQRAVVVWSPQ